MTKNEAEERYDQALSESNWYAGMHVLLKAILDQLVDLQEQLCFEVHND